MTVSGGVRLESQNPPAFLTQAFPSSLEAIYRDFSVIIISVMADEIQIQPSNSSGILDLLLGVGLDIGQATTLMGNLPQRRYETADNYLFPMTEDTTCPKLDDVVKQNLTKEIRDTDSNI